MHTATITLTSTLNGRQGACPREVVTYTCTLTQGSFLEWTAEPFLSATELRFIPTTPANSRMVDCDDYVNIQCTVFDFQSTVSITNINAGMTLADLTSTFRFTARAEINGTVVRCRVVDVNGLAAQNETLKAVGMCI